MLPRRCGGRCSRSRTNHQCGSWQINDPDPRRRADTQNVVARRWATAAPPRFDSPLGESALARTRLSRGVRKNVLRSWRCHGLPDATFGATLSENRAEACTRRAYSVADGSDRAVTIGGSEANAAAEEGCPRRGRRSCGGGDCCGGGGALSGRSRAYGWLRTGPRSVASSCSRSPARSSASGRGG